MNLGFFKKIKEQRGFSLMEVVIATGIITMGLLGIFSLVIQNIKVQTTNRDYLIASMLAQEGIELVRNIRDRNWLDPEAEWSDGILGDGSYRIDYINGASNVDDVGVPNDFTDDTGARLYLDQSAGNEGYYSHDSTGIVTPFFRMIKVVDNGDYVELDSTVQWRDKRALHSYSAYTTLYDWR